MHNELYDNFTYVFQENNELSTKLQQAETENASLKSKLITLSEKLEDANNEIGRLGMVLKHRVHILGHREHPFWSIVNTYSGRT